MALPRWIAVVHTGAKWSRLPRHPACSGLSPEAAVFVDYTFDPAQRKIVDKHSMAHEDERGRPHDARPQKESSDYRARTLCGNSERVFLTFQIFTKGRTVWCRPEVKNRKLKQVAAPVWFPVVADVTAVAPGPRSAVSPGSIGHRWRWVSIPFAGGTWISSGDLTGYDLVIPNRRRDPARAWSAHYRQTTISGLWWRARQTGTSFCRSR